MTGISEKLKNLRKKADSGSVIEFDSADPLATPDNVHQLLTMEKTHRADLRDWYNLSPATLLGKLTSLVAFVQLIDFPESSYDDKRFYGRVSQRLSASLMVLLHGNYVPAGWVYALIGALDDPAEAVKIWMHKLGNGDKKSEPLSVNDLPAVMIPFIHRKYIAILLAYAQERQDPETAFFTMLKEYDDIASKGSVLLRVHG